MAGLSTSFANATKVMEWLNDCAGAIAESGEPVEWRTPVGLPVVQPYRKTLTKVVHTALQMFTVTSQSNLGQPVVKGKQRTAFPPNYIHSLDSAHMMLTAVACDKAGITFAGVHDSFWTHAATVDAMNTTLRDCFVQMHSRPLLEELRHSFRERYPKLDLPATPGFGSLQLEEVRNSPYFFS